MAVNGVHYKASKILFVIKQGKTVFRWHVVLNIILIGIKCVMLLSVELKKSIICMYHNCILLYVLIELNLRITQNSLKGV